MLCVVSGQWCGQPGATAAARNNSFPNNSELLLLYSSYSLTILRRIRHRCSSLLLFIVEKDRFLTAYNDECAGVRFRADTYGSEWFSTSYRLL